MLPEVLPVTQAEPSWRSAASESTSLMHSAQRLRGASHPGHQGDVLEVTPRSTAESGSGLRSPLCQGVARWLLSLFPEVGTEK